MELIYLKSLDTDNQVLLGYMIQTGALDILQ